MRACRLQQDARRGRHRPCKATRNQCKQLLAQMNDLYKDDPEQILGGQRAPLCKLTVVCLRYCLFFCLRTYSFCLVEVSAG